jgi:hypothetical protein
MVFQDVLDIGVGELERLVLMVVNSICLKEVCQESMQWILFERSKAPAV